MNKLNISKNLLPCDGTLLYQNDFLDNKFYQLLLSDIMWSQSSIKIFGKDIKEPRLTAWYADEGINYKYSGRTNIANKWTPTLLIIKKLVEDKCETNFNGVLLNYYRSEKDYMGWHSDNEKELGKHPIIASISLGEERKFQLKHKNKTDLDIVTILPKNGSLLIMKDQTQDYWKHRLSKTTVAKKPRINLTFRKIT